MLAVSAGPVTLSEDEFCGELFFTDKLQCFNPVLK
jgi:hypothetical protein